MTMIVAASGGGNWTTGATWVGGVAPTAADDAVLDATSGNVTITSGSVARSLDCTGYTGTLTHNAVGFNLGDGTAGSGNAALTLSAGMTYTLINSSTSSILFISTSTTQQSITTAGKTLGNVTFNGSGGTWLLADDFICSALLVSAGTFNTGSRTITCATFSITGSTSVGTLGDSVINMTSTTASAVLFSRGNNGVLNAGAVVFNVVNATANSRTFSPSSLNLGSATLNYTVAGSSGTLVFTAAMTLGTLNVSDASGARTISFAIGVAYSIGTFNVNGSPAGLISVISGTSGSPATLTKTSRVVSSDYLSIKDITASGGASWYAGVNSVNVSGVTGWMFTEPSNTQFFQFA